MEKELPPPKSMTKWARNRRLYETLLGMGLICEPVFADKEGNKIQSLYVSCGEFSIPADVHAPVKGSKVIDMVGSPRAYRDNVVDFPPIL